MSTPVVEAQPHIFISYARADDETFVERLHRDLEAAGIKVWWDRDKMASRGRTFLQEIRDAIEAVDRVIAVIGPGAIHSDYVRYEWNHAALFAKGLPRPPTAVGAPPPRLLPARLMNWVSFRKSGIRAAASGAGGGKRRSGSTDGGTDRRHEPSDAAGLGAPAQREGAGPG